MEKMMFRILLLLKLTSCVCGTFVVNVTQRSYQAEENKNITLEWTFTKITDSSLNSLFILCELLADLKPVVLFDLHEGVEVPESQDQQFVGRVQSDLREGRIRLHVSRLRTDDSGQYVCKVGTKYDYSSEKCRLNVTAAADEPERQRPTERPQPERPQPERPQPESRGRIGLYFVGPIAASLAVCACFFYSRGSSLVHQAQSGHSTAPPRQRGVSRCTSEVWHATHPGANTPPSHFVRPTGTSEREGGEKAWSGFNTAESDLQRSNELLSSPLNAPWRASSFHHDAAAVTMETAAASDAQLLPGET